MLLTVVPVWLVLIPSALQANTITVNTTADPGTSAQCSLRAAINNANNKTSSALSSCAAGTGNDAIVFSVSDTITLGSTLPAITNLGGSLTIDGSGHKITVSGDGKYQVLAVDVGATLNLNKLTIANGSADSGGGIDNEGTLIVTNSTFSHNSGSGQGGGIFNHGGTLTVTNSTFSYNSGSGGGITTGGTATVTNSSFFNNSSSGVGGGIKAYSTLTVANSSFFNNSAGFGGGIYNHFGGTLTVTNSIFNGNSGSGLGGGGIGNSGALTVTDSTFDFNGASGSAIESGAGGGIDNYGGTLTVTNSTFLANGASGSGGGIENYKGSTTVSNSILSNNTPGGNCGVFKATIDNGGYNISNDGTCHFGSFTAANGDTIGDDVMPLLKTLANNGGPTETIALKPKSPAIDAIPIDLCPATDQRGAPRPDPGDTTAACDIGAFESGNLVWLAPSALDFGTINVGQSSAAQTVTLYNQSGKKLTIEGATISGPDFVMVSSTCSSVLDAGQSCNFLISFEPQSSGTLDELFQVFDSGPYSPQQVQLQGATPNR
jgi:CSLREA domain-containing protein